MIFEFIYCVLYWIFCSMLNSTSFKVFTRDTLTVLQNVLLSVKREELQHCSCNVALKCGDYFEECQLCEKTAIYELLRTDIGGLPAQVFTRYHEKYITRIRSHVYGKKSKLTKCVIGYDANSLYLYCSGDVMPYTICCSRDS